MPIQSESEMNALLSKGLKGGEYEVEEIEDILIYFFATYGVSTVGEFCSMTDYNTIVSEHYQDLSAEQQSLLDAQAYYVIQTVNGVLTDLIQLPYNTQQFDLILQIGMMAEIIGVEYEALFEKAEELRTQQVANKQQQITEEQYINTVAEDLLATVDIF